MTRSTKQYGRLVLVLGLLDLAWSAQLVFLYILKVPDMVFMLFHIILLLNAVGLIHLF